MTYPMVLVDYKLML